MPTELFLPFEDEPAPADPQLTRDEAARAFAVDPSRNVVLEASAGTGKTRVLVTRYVNLLRSGVDPANILAITFTRKAAAEMRERIVQDLRAAATRSAADAARWRDLRDRLGEIGICTIDAFCLALLREFPLEADLDPGFQVADETEVPRVADEALDAAFRAGRRLARHDEHVALLLAGVGERKLREGLLALLGRRLVVGPAIRRFLAASPGLTPTAAFERALARVADAVQAAAGSMDGFLRDGPVLHPAFALFQADLRSLTAVAAGDGPRDRSALDRVSAHFLKKGGAPRQRLAPPFQKRDCASGDAYKRHSDAIGRAAPVVAEAMAALGRDLNRGMTLGVERLFRIASGRYSRVLEAQASVDFTEALERTLALLRRMDEFSQSRYRLEARYHHVLVDEFQDTSRAQWRLVARLVESWGEGAGLAHDAPLQPSVFVVGDRKQSIYAFRDADVGMLRRARRFVRGLRPDGDVRRSIARSFRSAPPLLAFANDLFHEVEKVPGRVDSFRYAAADRFPVEPAPRPAGAGRREADGNGGDVALGLIADASSAGAASALVQEVSRLLAEVEVRDRQTGLPRPARPGDIGILFRSRESHRDYEAALEARGIPTYVYKGLGFFDADEVKDLVALLRFLSNPVSDLRAAALLRSGIVRLSDPALRLLAPSIARALVRRDDEWLAALPAEDAQVLRRLRDALPRWLALVDRVPPAELLDHVLADAAYAFVLRGGRELQARENVKKVRALLRRIQNRGYATLPRIARHLDRLSAGDESNAIVDAVDAVNLMTVHAAKGLEFPIVFLVNLGRGTGGHGDPVLVVDDPRRGEPLVSVDGGLAEAEDALRARDVEETKRLLYVAVTRARERLYLSAVVRDGRFRPGRGSLGEVLPPGFRELFPRAAAAAGRARIAWIAQTGTTHEFVACPPAPVGEPADAAGALASAARPGGSRPRVSERGAVVDALNGADRPAGSADFDPWTDEVEVPRVPATMEARATAGPADEIGRGGGDARATRQVVGTLVHRLFQAFAGAADISPSDAADRAAHLVLPEELAEVDDPPAAIEEAVAAFLTARARPDLAFLATAECLYEVPFSLVVPGEDATTRRVIRGTMDCLAVIPGGRVVVVEIKTGPRHSWHQLQLEWYLRAARDLFPGRDVESLLVYA
jgi:ATP-dependent helicase/nuclease subunit A